MAYPTEQDAVYVDAYKTEPQPLFVHGSEIYAAYDMELQRDLRAAGTFRFSITDRHPLYGELIPRKSEISIKRFGRFYWSGYVNRIIGSESGVKTYECIGVLDYLNDSIQMPVALIGIDETQAFEYLLERHNEQMYDCSHKQIMLERDYSGGSMDLIIEKPMPTLEVIRQYFNYGVYEFDRTFLTLKLHHRAGRAIVADNQGVEYGGNLISLKEVVSGSGIITRLIPLGKNGDDFVTIANVNNGSLFIDTDAVPQHTPIVGTVTFNDISDPAQLLAAARSYLSKLQTSPTRTLSVDALDKYVLGSASEPMPLGGIVRLNSAPHGIINDDIECTSVSETIGQPESGRFRFGDI